MNHGNLNRVGTVAFPTNDSSDSLPMLIDLTEPRALGNKPATVRHLRRVPYIGVYSDLVVQFLEAGYEACSFHTIANATGELVLRHDVDFDCQAALTIAKEEAALGVGATYFFLLRSHSYNVLEPENARAIDEIRQLGHEIALHFDPTLYDDPYEGVELELQLFRHVFQVPAAVLSFHRPSPQFQALDSTFGGLVHTYQPKFTTDISYMSDSQGSFRFGHPLQSPSFTERRSVQLLTHPIWWTRSEHSNIAILEGYLDDRRKALTEHIAANCIPFRNHLRSVSH